MRCHVQKFIWGRTDTTEGGGSQFAQGVNSLNLSLIVTVACGAISTPAAEQRVELLVK